MRVVSSTAVCLKAINRRSLSSIAAGSGKLQCICSGSLGKAGQLSRTLSQCDKVVETLTCELVHVFGTLGANIHSHGGYRLHRVRVYTRRHGACAEDLYASPSQVLHDTLGHLGARAVVSAEEEHPGRWQVIHTLVVSLVFFRLQHVSVYQGGVEGVTVREVQIAQMVQVDAVIDVAGIGRAAPFFHQVLLAQALEVVRD